MDEVERLGRAIPRSGRRPPRGRRRSPASGASCPGRRSRGLDQVGQVALRRCRPGRSARRPGRSRSHAQSHLLILELAVHRPRGRGRRWPRSSKRPPRSTAVAGRLGDQLGAAAGDGVGVVEDLEAVSGHATSASRRGRRTACASPTAACRAKSSRSRESKRSYRAVVRTRRRHALLDRRDRGPAALAGVRDAAVELRERRATRAAPRRSGRAARSRSRCRAARPRRPRGCRGRTGSTRGGRAGAVSASTSRSTLPALAFLRMLSPSA